MHACLLATVELGRPMVRTMRATSPTGSAGHRFHTRSEGTALKQIACGDSAASRAKTRAGPAPPPNKTNRQAPKQMDSAAGLGCRHGVQWTSRLRDSRRRLGISENTQSHLQAQKNTGRSRGPGIRALRASCCCCCCCCCCCHRARCLILRCGRCPPWKMQYPATLSGQATEASVDSPLPLRRCFGRHLAKIPATPSIRSPCNSS